MAQERADEDVELAKTNFDVLKGRAILNNFLSLIRKSLVWFLRLTFRRRRINHHEVEESHSEFRENFYLYFPGMTKNV